jgi:hypothetical protein
VIRRCYDLSNGLSFQRRVKVASFHLIHICFFQLIASDFNANVGLEGHLERFPVVLTFGLIKVSDLTVDFHNELHGLAECHLP